VASVNSFGCLSKPLFLVTPKLRLRYENDIKFIPQKIVGQRKALELVLPGAYRVLNTASTVIVIWVPAPDARVVGQAGDVLAMRFVIPADLPDKSASALARTGAPCPGLVGGCR
jgi:hypothetical protein